MSDSPEMLDAVVAADLLARRRLSARELAEHALARIEAVNPVVNAVVSARDGDAVLADADAADERAAHGEPLGPLHGLPMAVKDLADVAGLPTRQGSTTSREAPVTADSLFVARLRVAGAVFLGKTNTPEFGTGSHTFNPVFGVTGNAYDPSRSAGGSSGGAAVALATRMIPLADGSDYGGSLRNPAAWNNVVGLRPSIGRVPRLSPWSGFMSRLGVEGPMARCVDDAALLLSVMAGPDARDPLSRSEPGPSFRTVERVDAATVAVAWGGSMGGVPIEPEVMAGCERALHVFETLGAKIEHDRPTLAGAMDSFRVHRAFHYRSLAELIPADRLGEVKATVRANIDEGLRLTVEDLVRAENLRTAIHTEVVEFFDRYDVLALPVTQVMPFPVETEYPTEVAGVAMDDYLGWMEICCLITITGCPALSLPAGFGESGLPIGLQLVAAPGAERRLLSVAAALEDATGHHRELPSLLG